MTSASGNWRLGLLYASITTLAWGLLPIALKAMLAYMDPYTITWYRFFVSALLLLAFLGWRGRLPRLRGLVDHEETGLLVPADDVEAWTQAIRQAASSPVARKRWATNGRRFAEEHLSWEAVASQFETIFHEAREQREPAEVPNEAKAEVERA